MSTAYWFLFVGGFLITMVLSGTLVSRLPLSSAMIYLCLGFVLGPGGVGLIKPDPIGNASALSLIAEIALLISLFAVGLKLGVPLKDVRWTIALRLAFPSMLATVAMIVVIGVWFLNLSLGEALLLGGILSPTDPVLASGIHSEPGAANDPVRFGLAGEGALNDGSAFPFVMLGLGLMGLHDLGSSGWHWWVVDLLWSTLGGIIIGAVMGALIGMLVVYLRTRHHNAVGLDEFLSLGLIALSYGVAQLFLASGFLAVFAAGMALHRVREHPMIGTVSLDITPLLQGNANEPRSTHSHHASASMSLAVQGFTEQLERLAELAVVLLIGAMLPGVDITMNVWWFVPLLFFIIRPVAVWIGMIGRPLPGNQTAMMGWFGIRGIGSVFYLLFSLHHGVTGAFSQELITFTLVVVTASIVAHGMSALPLMRWYINRII